MNLISEIIKYIRSKKKFLGFFIFCLVIALFLSGNCPADEDYDYDGSYDPLDRGGPQICVQDITLGEVAFKTLMLALFGGIAYEFIKTAEEKA